MKYTEEQKSIVRNFNVNRFVKGETFKKDFHQIMLQQEIDSHYPIAERYFIIESKLNTIKL